MSLLVMMIDRITELLSQEVRRQIDGTASQDMLRGIQSQPPPIQLEIDSRFGLHYGFVVLFRAVLEIKIGVQTIAGTKLSHFKPSTQQSCHDVSRRRRPMDKGHPAITGDFQV